MTFRNYSVFGLRVRSEIALPELFEVAPGDADVTIRLGRTGVPGEFAGGLHPVDDGLLFVEPEVGRYRIAGGREIVVEARPDVPERNVRLFLLGSAFGALLHQRGLLPLHANAVEISGRAVAFMAAQGEGKSTLAAWFHDQGHRIVADDVCVIKFDAKEQAFAVPGLPRLRLWREVLETTGREASRYERSYVGSVTYDKYDVPLGPEAAATDEIRLAALYVLERGDRFDIAESTGLDAAEVAFAHTYRGAYVAAAKNELDHWRACVRLVRGTPIYRVRRPLGLDQLDLYSRRILAHAEAIAADQLARSGVNE